jgi:DNA-binding NtrC family response regulator
MTTNKNTILVADDKENLRGLYVLFLEGAFRDYQIQTFENGNQLIGRLEKDVSDVAVVITDNDFGNGPRGIDILRKYSGKKNYPPFILSTGEKGNIENEVKNLGANYFFKSNKIEQFIEIVTSILNKDKKDN